MISVLPVQLVYDDCAEEEFILTIAIPTYKRFNLLRECLVNLSASNFIFPVEIIVVDNDPENADAAMQFIESIGIKHIRYFKNNENYGMFGNWNQCLGLARGRYVTLLHDDDLLDATFGVIMNRLVSNKELFSETLIGFNVSILDQRASEDVVHTNTLLQRIKEKARRSREKNIRVVGLDDLFTSNPFQGTLGVVMQRDKVVAIGGFNQDMYPISDYDFWIRWVTQFGKISIHPESVGRYRIQKNESLRKDVIQGFINKNVELRERIVSTSDASFIATLFVKLKKLNDKLDCDYLWAGSGNKFGILKTIFYIAVKTAVFFLKKAVKLKIKAK
ncbi:glycosyltransferase family 2 protein [Kosakonia sacchari]